MMGKAATGMMAYTATVDENRQLVLPRAVRDLQAKFSLRVRITDAAASVGAGQLICREATWSARQADGTLPVWALKARLK